MSKATRRRTERRSNTLGPSAVVLYCDFDHTLHATDAYRTRSGLVPGSPQIQFFEFAPILEHMLAAYPPVLIVLSTSWVQELGFTETRNRIPLSSLRARVVGATYDPDDETASMWSAMSRGSQVLHHVRRYGLKRWLAIDDDRKGFDGYESHLIHCQHGIGLGGKDVQQLFARRLELMFGPPDSLSHTGASTPEHLT
ncbi:HAD domain-containing protein [Paraburkholderia terrae]